MKIDFCDKSSFALYLLQIFVNITVKIAKFKLHLFLWKKKMKIINGNELSIEDVCDVAYKNEEVSLPQDKKFCHSKCVQIYSNTSRN